MVASRFTLAAAFLVLAQLVAPRTAIAQASREGPSFGVAGGWGTAVRLPDAAFDPANGVYLAVSGNLTHGRFFNENGVLLGPPPRQTLPACVTRTWSPARRSSPP